MQAGSGPLRRQLDIAQQGRQLRRVGGEFGAATPVRVTLAVCAQLMNRVVRATRLKN